MLKSVNRMMALLCYFTASIFKTVLNKAIVGTFNFRMHYFLILVQSSAISAILIIYYALKGRKLILGNVNKWCVASALLTVMVFSNMKAVFYFPVTLFTLYKNLSIVLVAFLEHKIFNKKITRSSAFCFFIIIATSYTAHITDYVPPVGYAWMLANIASTAGFMLYLKKAMASDTNSRTEAVLFTNGLSLPILAALSGALDPPEFMFHSPLLWTAIAASSVFAFLTAFTTAWTLQAVSSTALCMLGALNKLLLSASGFIFFKESSSFLKILSLFAGIAAGGLYSYSSIKAEEQIPLPVADEGV